MGSLCGKVFVKKGRQNLLQGSTGVRYNPGFIPEEAANIGESMRGSGYGVYFRAVSRPEFVD